MLTGKFRASYAHVFEPQVPKGGGDAKYSITLLIPKSDTATYQDILNSIEAAAADAQGKMWDGVRPPVLPQPLHDGDGVRENGTPYGAECKGHWVMTASSKVVHQSNINAELAPQDIYSGMHARVTVNFYGYVTGKKGVGCGLGNVMKTRDGEPLAGGASAESDFGAVGGTVAPAPAYPATAAPAYGGVPAGASKPSQESNA